MTDIRVPASALAFLLLAAAASAAEALLPSVLTNKPFKTSYTLNALLTRGNTETLECGGRLDTEGATDHFESIRAGAAFAYGKNRVEEEEETTARRWEFFGNAHRPIELNRTYTFMDGKMLSDAVADIHYRVTEGGGVGLYVFKREKALLSVDSGLSWVFEETSDDSDQYPAIRLSERLEYEWPKGAKATQNVELLPNATRLNEFLVNADGCIETVINDELCLRTAIEYHFQSNPPDDANTYDLRLVVGITRKL